jgi:hypothetical protein
MPVDNRATRRAQRAARGDHAPVPAGYDADAKAKLREDTPVTIGGHEFRRRRKTWKVSRRMRELSRDQERNVALGERIRHRIAELETEQTEAATAGDTQREEDLEEQIEALVAKADEGTEVAETATYRLLALLLIPPLRSAGDGQAPALEGFGVLDDDELRDDTPAVEFLQVELDTEDALGILVDLGVAQGGAAGEPDPQTTPSSGSSST